jgi:WD40 repeat protein
MLCTERKKKIKDTNLNNKDKDMMGASIWRQLTIVCRNIRSHHSQSFQHFSTSCLKLLYVLLSSHHTLPNKFFQLEFSTIVLDGHRDSVNALKFDADLSMLLSGGK